jgi:hypothetical protein
MVSTMIAKDQAALDRRVDALLARIAIPGSPSPTRSDWLEARRSKWILGTFDQARAAVRRFADAGVERLMLQDLLPWDLGMIRDMGRELVGRV